MRTSMVVGLFVAVAAGAISATAEDMPPILGAPEPDSVTGFQLESKGKINRLMSLELRNGANAMLHGYVPVEGDVVEWYVRKVDDCAEPDKLCSFELAIRKRCLLADGSPCN